MTPTGTAAKPNQITDSLGRVRSHSSRFNMAAMKREFFAARPELAPLPIASEPAAKYPELIAPPTHWLEVG